MSSPTQPVGPRPADGNHQAYVDDLMTGATARLRGDEKLLASFDGEESDFVRFNGGAVRQAGSVRQLRASLDLVDGARHAMATVQLAGSKDIDGARVGDLIERLREQVAVVPEDPYLSFNTTVESSERHVPGTPPDAAEAIDQLRAETDGLDAVGIYAGGRQFSGFANSLGQRNWSDVETFNLDWSIHLSGDKATKGYYAGFDWEPTALSAKIDEQRHQLAALARPPIDLEPGGYRAYLSPSAVDDLTSMLGSGGFSIRSHRNTDSPLLRMVTDGITFADEVDLIEDVVGGVSPDFQAQGFRRPAHVSLIEKGRFGHHLVSPRSSVEYDVATNGAGDMERPTSVTMATGTIPAADADQVLGTGIHVGNLHYLNFSDRVACRTTGLTRFATFWVENGEIVAPVNVLRFDDTAFRLLGDHLVGLTDTQEVLLDPISYGARSTASSRIPGAVVEEMRFTL